jgi:hypothetical protein
MATARRLRAGSRSDPGGLCEDVVVSRGRQGVSLLRGALHCATPHSSTHFCPPSFPHAVHRALGKLPPGLQSADLPPKLALQTPALVVGKNVGNLSREPVTSIFIKAFYASCDSFNRFLVALFVPNVVSTYHHGRASLSNVVQRSRLPPGDAVKATVLTGSAAVAGSGAAYLARLLRPSR